MLALLGSAANAQDKDKDHEDGRADHRGLVQDWTGRHIVFSRFGPLESLLAAQHDPRAIDAWEDAYRRDWRRGWHDRNRRSAESTEHRDWAIPLGPLNGVAVPINVYPAKYSFSITASPDCANDFVVFPVNAPGSGTQPNLVALNQLYSGTVPSSGICNRASSSSDSGVAAETLWSYNIEGIGAGSSVATSPTLSLDGKKVAFVETEAGHAAHFHVLAWKATDGQDPANLQNTFLPATISSFTGSAPTAGTGTATDLVLGSTASDTDTLSSPFVDYSDDVAYVGNDNGTLFRVKNVFCGIGSACAGAGSPAPSLDTAWPSGTGGGSIAVCAGKKMSAPVVDAVTGNIFVGCADGNLYGYTSAGAKLTNSPLTVGDGTAAGGIVDPVLIDAIHGFVYVTSGSGSGVSNPVLVQAKTDLSLARVADIGLKNTGTPFNLHDPDFNDAYFSNGTSSTWFMYIMGLNSTGTQSMLYGVGFVDSAHNMAIGTPSNAFTFDTPREWGPVTHFLNGATDQLYVSGAPGGATNFYEFNITSGFPGGFTSSVTEGNATSGIIIDNTSGSNQASSVYFETLGSSDAVKLTQSGLN
jgi:hypothetical protein